MAYFEGEIMCFGVIGFLKSAETHGIFKPLQNDAHAKTCFRAHPATIRNTVYASAEGASEKNVDILRLLRGNLCAFRVQDFHKKAETCGSFQPLQNDA